MIDRLARRRRMLARLALVVATLTGGPALANAQRMLVPMDDGQTNHLKAYGLTYNAIKAGLQAEWLLNYRGGAFLLATSAGLCAECTCIFTTQPLQPLIDFGGCCPARA